MPSTPQTEKPDYRILFAKLDEPENSEILSLSAEVDRHVESIRELEAITRQIEQPFVGSYFTN